MTTVVREIQADTTADARRSPSTTVDVSLLTPSRYDKWNAYVNRHEAGSVFHTTAWKTTVEHTFRHEPFYLMAARDDTVVGVLPMFLVKSRLAGRLLVSVPYGVEGGVCADDVETARSLFDAARCVAEKHGCKAIDLRSETAAFEDLPVIDRYVGFRRDLPATPDDVLSWLPRKARAAARNGREKFRLSISYSDEHLAEVWRLYTRSMRRLASLNYPFRFFQTLIDKTPGRHWVSLVRWNGVPVAGLVTLCYGDRVLPYFLGTTDRAKRCSAANFIYLDCMERAVAGGYRVFDFGRSRRDNTGSYNFKHFQGFEPRPLQYQSFVPKGQTAPNLSPDNPKFGLARRLWPQLPLFLTRKLGAHLSTHVPG